MSSKPDLEDVAHLICGGVGLQFGMRVGAGAFKQSFKVFTAAGGPRALKVYNLDSVSPRTQREVDAISKCKHPNIVRFDYISTFEAAGVRYTYSVEEFLAGGTLTKKLESGLMPVAHVRALGGKLSPPLRTSPRMVSFTAISSPTTSCSGRAASRCSSISGSSAT